MAARFAKRILLPALIGAATAIVATGCGTPAPSPVATFVPQGGASTVTAPATSATSAGVTAATPGLRDFTFPASIKIEFQTPLPVSGPQRAAMIAYENYIESMWHAVYTHGADTTYKKYVFGNDLTFAHQEIREFTSGGYQLSGTITYFDMTVPNVYFGAGAVVDSCIDASQMAMVNDQTGKRAGTLFTGGFNHYQEQAATGKSSGGYWIVSHSDNYPSSDGGAAGVCAG
jgi:hypothetical protein